MFPNSGSRKGYIVTKSCSGVDQETATFLRIRLPFWVQGNYILLRDSVVSFGRTTICSAVVSHGGSRNGHMVTEVCLAVGQETGYGYELVSHRGAIKGNIVTNLYLSLARKRIVDNLVSVVVQ